MPRPPRQIYADQCYHVLNRANRRAEIFHESADYSAFIALMVKGQEHVDLPILATCLMPNHVHLVVRPRGNGDLSRWMHWLFTTHVRHYHEKRGTNGRLWQGPFKAFIVQTDHYLLTLLRYVERNAQRANLVERAEHWRWGSLRWRTTDRSPFPLAPSPVPLPSYWVDLVNMPQTAAELEAIRASVNKQQPFGDPEWVARHAEKENLSQVPGGAGRRRTGRPVPNR
jgi:putative transposase